MYAVFKIQGFWGGGGVKLQSEVKLYQNDLNTIRVSGNQVAKWYDNK